LCLCTGSRECAKLCPAGPQRINSDLPDDRWQAAFASPCRWLRVKCICRSSARARFSLLPMRLPKISASRLKHMQSSGPFGLPLAFNETNCDLDGRAETNRHARKARQRLRICPSPRAQAILRPAERQAAVGIWRPKIEAYRLKYVQPSRLSPGCSRLATEQTYDREGPSPKWPTRRQSARELRICLPLLAKAVNRSRNQTPVSSSRSRHADQNLSGLWCRLPRSFRIFHVLPWNSSISAHLGRRLGTPFDSFDRGIARGGA
jgi:hypothetical protein